MIALPPFEAGAVQLTVAWPLPGCAPGLVGAPGTVPGVTDTEPDAAEFPTEFVATTVNEYGVPFVNPVTVQLVVDPSGVVHESPEPSLTV